VLNVADNLRQAYGDKATIEVVAFGPGLNLLFAENSNSDRINKLSEGGVRFSACGNTRKKISKLVGSEKELNQNAVEVQAGAARIVDLVQQGYVLLRP
jgi:intracellular sulfur oxidation DsrE/DsrF family protein